MKKDPSEKIVGLVTLASRGLFFIVTRNYSEIRENILIK